MVRVASAPRCAAVAVVGSRVGVAVPHQLATGRQGASGMPERRRAVRCWPALAAPAKSEPELPSYSDAAAEHSKQDSRPQHNSQSRFAPVAAAVRRVVSAH